MVAFEDTLLLLTGSSIPYVHLLAPVAMTVLRVGGSTEETNHYDAFGLLDCNIMLPFL